MKIINNLQIKSIKHLMAVLNCTLPEVEYIIANKPNYYYIKEEIKFNKEGNIRYDSTGNIEYRTLTPSIGRLKEIQTKIKDRILSNISLPENIKGGVKGYDNIANARVHLGKNYKFKTDIKQYFPSIKYDRVFCMYVRNGCSPKIASILTHLTTHNFELPQGTPTSTHIANLIFLPNDFLIISYCKNNNLTYSRFVDDLVFSSSFDFKMKCNDLIKIILNDNFRISYKKTVYKAGNMEICGIITKQNVLDLSDSFKKSLEDPTINKSKIDGRRRYYQRVRAK